MHRENMIALSHQYGKQFKHIQELDMIDSSDSKTSGYSKGAVVNFNRFRNGRDFWEREGVRWVRVSCNGLTLHLTL